MSHAPDSTEVGSTVLSGASALAGTVLSPHPLQIIAWAVAIIAGLYAIYRGYKAERRADEAAARERQAFEEE